MKVNDISLSLHLNVHAAKNVQRSDCVLEALRHYVATQRLRPGDRLPGELQLSQALGISRNAVREGLKALQVAGLVTRRPRRGTILRSVDFSEAFDSLVLPVMPSPQEIEELTEARHCLELALLPLIAANARPRDYRRMEAAIAQQLRELEEGKDGLDGDMAFHRALLQAAGNRYLAQMAEIVRKHLVICRRMIQSGLTQKPQPTRTFYVQEHREIMEALKRGDVVTAQRILEVHLVRTRTAVTPPKRKNGGRPKSD